MKQLYKKPQAKSIAVTCLMLSGLTTALFSQAQDTSLMVDVGPCITLESAVQRFACYEAQTDAALTGGEAFTAPVQVSAPPAPAQQAAASQQPSAPNPPATVNRSAPAVSQSDPDSTFGLPQPRDESNRGDELFGVIAEVSQNIPNRYTITLSNGQVWRQTEGKKNFRLEEGDEVRIYTSRWSSNNYRLEVLDGKGFIRIERVQ